MSIVEKIKLENFRNLSDQIVLLEPNINCIYGLNGNGKTNVLEAIYLSINKKSFRKKAGFQQMLSIDCEKPVIISSLTIKNHLNEIDYYSSVWESNKFRCLKNNNQKIRRPEINCVFVSPFDSFSFHNESTFRRTQLDLYISSIFPEYKKTLNNYNKLLTQKNFLLKLRNHDSSQLDAIDKVLAKQIVILSRYRNDFVNEINPYLENIYHEIFSENVHLKAELGTDFSSTDVGDVFAKIKSNRENDFKYGHSKVGPHRDEFNLMFNGFDSVEFCSLGQQKTAYLSLLFAYINLFRYKFRVFPLVLIDDVSGELDSIRLELLMRYLFKADYQVVLTTANEEFKNNLSKFGDTNIVNVKDGFFH